MSYDDHHILFTLSTSLGYLSFPDIHETAQIKIMRGNVFYIAELMQIVMPML